MLQVSDTRDYFTSIVANGSLLGSGPGFTSAYGAGSPRNSRFGGMTSPVSDGPPGRQPVSAGYNNAGSTGGAESWKRAAEVTQNLKARIEMMKVRHPTSAVYKISLTHCR
jgi:cytoskeleton-associated protein 5